MARPTRRALEAESLTLLSKLEAIRDDLDEFLDGEDEEDIENDESEDAD